MNNSQELPRIDPDARVAVPVTHLPIFRSTIAIQAGVQRNLLLRTWGGLGDQICAEPTLRFALKHFKECDISLASECPELFAHLEFKRVFDLRDVKPNYAKYFLFDTITPPTASNMVWQFFSHLLTNCVDFASLCALRMQLPVSDREIKLVGDKLGDVVAQLVQNAVLVHPGRHWASKTFPKKFWDGVLKFLIMRGITPVIIGANTDDNRGTVDVDTDGCVDLRNQLTVMQSIGACQMAKVLLTNDSAPLHMAASGDAWIGYVATCKHPDYITHWRKGQFQWREVNFGKGGCWDLDNYLPDRPGEISVEAVPEDLLMSWLPDPDEMAAWAASMAKCD